MPARRLGTANPRVRIAHNLALVDHDADNLAILCLNGVLRQLGVDPVARPGASLNTM